MTEPECFRDRIVYRSPVAAIGECRCMPASESWGRPREIQSGHILIFPRTSVSYCHEGSRPFVSGPNLVTFFNHRQPYRSKLVSPQGSWMEYFFLRGDILLDMIRTLDPTVVERPERPFRIQAAVCSSRQYRLQRMLYHHVTAYSHPDPVFVDEQVVRLHAALIEDGYRQFGLARSSGPNGGQGNRHREAAEEIKSWMAGHFLQPLQLGDVAAAVDMSVFHVCRLFRQQVGLTLHRYLVHLRLRHSLEFLLDPRLAIRDIARQVGFAHQSHFTSSFRSEFGLTPAAYRSAVWRPSSARINEAVVTDS